MVDEEHIAGLSAIEASFKSKMRMKQRVRNEHDDGSHKQPQLVQIKQAPRLPLPLPLLLLLLLLLLVNKLLFHKKRRIEEKTTDDPIIHYRQRREVQTILGS